MANLYQIELQHVSSSETLLVHPSHSVFRRREDAVTQLWSEFMKHPELLPVDLGELEENFFTRWNVDYVYGPGLFWVFFLVF
jgi:hypothetical protein